MTTKLNAAARLVATEVSAFNDAQLTALRQHILPLMEKLQRPYYYNATTWIPEYMKNGVKKSKTDGWGDNLTPEGKAFWDVMTLLNLTSGIVEAVLTKASPARRAVILKSTLKRTGQSWAKVPADKLLSRVMLLIKKVPPRLLTEKGQAIVTEINSTYFQLLRKSWPYIVSECESEFADIMKQNHLSPGTLPADKMWKAFQAALPGWTFEEKESTYAKKEMLYTATAADKLTKLQFFHKFYGDDAFTIIPQWRMDEQDSWRSWAKTGVDAGDMSFDRDTYSVEGAVEEALAKVEEARTARQKLLDEGKDYDFGGSKLKLLPSKLEEIVKSLQDGRSFTVGSGGFGKYTIYTTKAVARSQPAAEWLTQKVGKDVYYYTEERD
jgi:hypothetical protein